MEGREGRENKEEEEEEEEEEEQTDLEPLLLLDLAMEGTEDHTGAKAAEDLVDETDLIAGGQEDNGLALEVHLDERPQHVQFLRRVDNLRGEAAGQEMVPGRKRKGVGARGRMWRSQRKLRREQRRRRTRGRDYEGRKENGEERRGEDWRRSGKKRREEKVTM